MIIPRHTEELLDDLAELLQIPASRYEAAERSYKSVGEWLHRDQSRLKDANPQVYIQGSFRLGTVIKPVSEEDDYDVDLVCELSLSKTSLTQSQLKQALGLELKGYAEAHSMCVPEEGRRCWTQNYADGAQFHLDTLPSIPDALNMRHILTASGYSTEWAETAIAITDRDHPNFQSISVQWPHSNPKGYGDWFKSRMVTIFDQRRHMLALECHANVEDIPEYKVRTPLQSAIQLLKRHRDMMYKERSDDKPISIILTTLAAHAYQQESTISNALYGILQRMSGFIEMRNGVAWIPNPTDPAENFADRWQQYPERKEAFYEWLEQAKKDFSDAAQALSRTSAAAILQPKLGKQLVDTSRSKRRGGIGLENASARRQYGKILNPLHKKIPPWKANTQGEIRIEKAIMRQDGFRPREFYNDDSFLPKNCSLKFEASTNIPKPYQIYWQIVNTGTEAEAAGCLRGGFDEGVISTGTLTRSESTLYSGSHSIECFIVKDGLLAASSGQFIVNIQ